jgi:hypothetical protein
MKKIQEAVTFIKATKEEAMALVNNIVGDAEVHALVIQKGFTANPEPVGYMVVGKKEWVGLTDEEIKDIVWNMPYEPGQDEIRAIEAKLKERNT